MIETAYWDLPCRAISDLREQTFHIDLLRSLNLRLGTVGFEDQAICEVWLVRTRHDSVELPDPYTVNTSYYIDIFHLPVYSSNTPAEAFIYEIKNISLAYLFQGTCRRTASMDELALFRDIIRTMEIPPLESILDAPLSEHQCQGIDLSKRDIKFEDLILKLTVTDPNTYSRSTKYIPVSEIWRDARKQLAAYVDIVMDGAFINVPIGPSPSPSATSQASDPEFRDLSPLPIPIPPCIGDGRILTKFNRGSGSSAPPVTLIAPYVVILIGGSRPLVDSRPVVKSSHYFYHTM